MCLLSVLQAQNVVFTGKPSGLPVNKWLIKSLEKFNGTVIVSAPTERRRIMRTKVILAVFRFIVASTACEYGCGDWNYSSAYSEEDGGVCDASCEDEFDYDDDN